jgi:hypothetical protein
MTSPDNIPEEFSHTVKQLEIEFEGLPRETIQGSVAKIAQTWSGARVTTFLPLLVERYAREELRAKTRSGSRAG